MRPLENQNNVLTENGKTLQTRILSRPGIRSGLYILGAFLLFAAGYFIYYGRQAADSGSWRYLITHDDEYSYWAYAKGASETPASDGNPFYYEERGTTHSIPYTAAVLTGKISKWLHLPILFFFPIWHIGMPFLLWLALFLSLWKIWKYPPNWSAAISILVLLGTLFIRGQSQFLLFRFSRPGEALWLIFIWVSLAMNPLPNRKKQLGILFLISLIAFWLHPIYAMFGVLITSLEECWQFSTARDKKNIRTILLTWTVFLVAAGTYFLYLKLMARQNPKLIEIIAANQFRGVNWAAIGCYGLIASFVWVPNIIRREPLSKIARLCLFVFLMEPLTANIQVFLASDYQLGSHRYYFLIIEWACLLGLFIERIPALLESHLFQRLEAVIIGILVIAVGLIVTNPKINFFLYSPIRGIPFDELDNSMLLLEIIPVFFILVWLAFRFPKLRQTITRKPRAISAILLIAVLGFAFLPSQLAPDNRNFPFDGAYRWLAKNAQKNEVVLTLPASRRWMQDYLILHTDLKTYLNLPYGQKLTVDPEAKAYRRVFYNALLLGILNDVSVGNFQTLEEKINHLRLDYLLVNVPNPFIPRIQKQFQGIIEEVYRDERCLLWRISRTPVR